jgi:hypothetical protein
MTGDAFTSRSGRVLATNGVLHDEMLAIIQAHRKATGSTTVD